MKTNFLILLMVMTLSISSNAYSQDKCIFVSVGVSDVFWSSIVRGSEAAAKKLGYEIIERSVSDLEGETALIKQEKVLEWSANTLKCKGILLAPYNFKISEKIAELKNKGFITVYVDRDDDTPHIIASIKTKNKLAGAYAAGFMHDKIEKGKHVLIFRETKGVKTTERRIEGFLERANELGIQIIDAGYIGEVHGEIEMASKKWLEKYPNIGGVFTPNEAITLAVSYSMTKFNKDNVVHIGFDINKEILHGILRKEIYGVILQDPYNMGYSGVKILDAAIRGEAIERKNYSSFYFASKENVSSAKAGMMIENYGVELEN
jgi:ribose transport system substrate-binding protein